MSIAGTGVMLAALAAFMWNIDRGLRRRNSIDEIRGTPTLAGYLVLRPLAIVIGLLALIVLTVAVGKAV